MTRLLKHLGIIASEGMCRLLPVIGDDVFAVPLGRKQTETRTRCLSSVLETTLWDENCLLDFLRSVFKVIAVQFFPQNRSLSVLEAQAAIVVARLTDKQDVGSVHSAAVFPLSSGSASRISALSTSSQNERELNEDERHKEDFQMAMDLPAEQTPRILACAASAGWEAPRVVPRAISSSLPVTPRCSWSPRDSGDRWSPQSSRCPSDSGSPQHSPRTFSYL